MTMHNGLIRCVCGGTARGYVDYTGSKLIQCNKCGLSTMSYRDEKVAEKAWNSSMGNQMTMDQIRKAAGEITSSLPEKIYTRKDVKLVVLEVLKKLEEVER